MRKILLVTLIFAVVGVMAQEKSLQQLGGVYYAYPIESGVAMPDIQPVPDGYVAFYISHYGRHGSRWLPSDERYRWVNNQFANQKNLTDLGESVRKRLSLIWKNAKGHGGRLTPLGGRQHRGIAQRMFLRFPHLFTAEAHLTAHSSTVGRCRSSMLNFLSELQAQNPSLDILPVTCEEDMAWIAYTSPEEKALESRTHVPLTVSTDRFVKTLFIDPSKVENPERLFTELHTIASDIQDVELDVSLYDIFTREEMEAVYAMNNERMTICNGDESLNGGIPARSAVSLWRRIEADADAAITRGGVGADLRFGHDTNLYRLLTLMGVDTGGMGMDEILPMAANLQMVFYRNVAGDILVQLLHNEKSLGFRNWEKLKQQVSEHICSLE